MVSIASRFNSESQRFLRFKLESVSPNSFRHAGALFFLVSCTKAYPCSGWPWPKEFHDHREKDRSQKNPLSLLLLEADSSSLSLTVAEFCAEMRFVSHESLRVILLNSWLFHESSERFSLMNSSMVINGRPMILVPMSSVPLSNPSCWSILTDWM
jgi:hypothetical protein